MSIISRSLIQDIAVKWIYYRPWLYTHFIVIMDIYGCKLIYVRMYVRIYRYMVMSWDLFRLGHTILQWSICEHNKRLTMELREAKDAYTLAITRCIPGINVYYYWQDIRFILRRVHQWICGTESVVASGAHPDTGIHYINCPYTISTSDSYTDSSYPFTKEW